MPWPLSACLKYTFPAPVRAEPVEALPFFFHRQARREPFDKLRVNGFILSGSVKMKPSLTLDHIDREASERGFLIFAVHVCARSPHRFNHLVKADAVGAVSHQRKA